MIIKLLAIAVLSCITSGDARTSYDGYTVVRLSPQTQAQLEYLHNLAMTTTELDFWTYPSAINETVDVMLSPEQQESFRSLFRGMNMEKDVLIKDVGALEKQQRNEVYADYVSPFTEEAIPRFWTGYQSYATIIDLVNTLAAQNPNIASVETIGRSYESREIRLIKLGINQGGSKPIYFLNSLIHAREWITGATLTFFLQYLVDGYRNNTQEVVQLLTNFDVYIIPVLNPDGYEFTRSTTRLWRKSRMPNSGSTCIGTDLNRNWDHCFLCAGASTNPCSDTYAGTSPFNQPETRAISDYILSLSPRVRIYIDVHSYSQLLLYSWGNQTTNSNNAPDSAAQNSRGSAATNALTAVYNTRYTVGPITNTLYAASGSSVDWGYCIARSRYSYTIELRDTGTYGFQLPASQIVPSGLETNRFFITLAQQVINDPLTSPSFSNCR